jgi:hypothetical protein
MPEHICENEEERHEWRAEVLAFIRDHIEPGAVYRLSEADLLFAELLPEKPGWLEQSDYESARGWDSNSNDWSRSSVSTRAAGLFGVAETFAQPGSLPSNSSGPLALFEQTDGAIENGEPTARTSGR